MKQVELPEIPNVDFDIREYGAVSGGTVINTSSIQKAIEEASQKGGGNVVIPAGIWLTGPIELRSFINLRVESGAVLLFTKRKEDYPLYWSDFEGQEAVRCKSPITAEHASNIAITGQGVIDGNGQLWRMVKKFKVTEPFWKGLLAQADFVCRTNGAEIWLPTQTALEAVTMAYEGKSKELESMEAAEKYWDYFRPVMLHLYKCDHILIENITLQNSPAWNVHPCFCTHITIRNAVIRNPYYAQNGDGLDLESCRYAEIAHTVFDVGDDAICLKSGKGREARKTPGPTEDVWIHDCIVYHGHGGFVIGSEMSRGVKNVTVQNCSFIGTDVGIRIKSAIGRGGVVEDISIEDIQMINIEKEAIIMTMGYTIDTERQDVEKQYEADDIPYFRNITCKHITCQSAPIGVCLEGITPETISDIIIQDSEFHVKTDKKITNAQNIKFDNVVFDIEE